MKAFLLLFLMLGSSLAQEANDAPGRVLQLRLELLLVRLPAKRALALQADLREPTRAQRGQQALLDLIEKDQAELVDWPIVRTSSGIGALAANVSEVRYPTQFAQPRIIEDPVSPDVAVTPEPKAPERSEIDAENAQNKGTKKTAGLLAGVPATFETRDAGVTFEVHAVISDGGKTVSMQLAPRHVDFKGFRRTTVEAPGQYRVAVDQPEFQTQQVSTNITVKSGEPHLLSFKKLSEPKDTVEIFMLTATVEKIDVAEVSAPVSPKSPGKDGR